MRAMAPLVLSALAIMVRIAAGTSDTAENIDMTKPRPLIHAVSDIGHQFTFYADGRFHGQYLPGQPVAMSWGALYNYDFANANMLILPGCEPRLTYGPRDMKTIMGFLQAGGGVVLLGNGGDHPQNALATRFGCRFKGNATKPFKAVSDELPDSIEGNAQWMECKADQEWQVLAVDADDRPILARRTIGKGTLLASARGLAGSNPNASDNINAGWWIPLLQKTASGKQVDPKAPFRGRGLDELEYAEALGRITLRYSEYLKPYAQAMRDIYQRTKPVMRERMGVDLSEGMASGIGLLATGGGGFSSGRMLGLAVFWGGFPEREDGMIEFITHETVHSWVLPFAEIWNEPIATYVGDLVMTDMGYEEEGMRRIQACIGRARRIDPTMKLYDISGKSFKGKKALTGEQANAMHWGKTFWIFEELRKENPDVLADYFIAKRKLARPGVIKRYDANATVAVMSVAMGKDMFGWFKEHGFDVDRERSEITVTGNRFSCGLAMQR